MIAAYDLECNPPTYDFCTFLGHVELERIRRKADKVQVKILPGPVGGFRRDGLWPKTIEERKLLLERIVLPMAKLLPSCNSVEVASRAGADGYFGFRKRLISLQKFLEVMKAGIRPLRYHSPRPIANLLTVTLRESSHWPERNSNVEEWRKACFELKKMGYAVVLLRDTAKAAEIFDPGITQHKTAPINLMERAFLYSSAAMNLGINNGPMWVAILMNAPVLMLKPTTEISGCYNNQYFLQCGFIPGTQLPTSPPFQKVVWKGDSCENIIEAFKEVEEVIK